MVTIDWLEEDEDEDLLDWCWCLYAYVDPETGEILYIGKAGRCSVYERMCGRHKEDVFADIEDEYGLTADDLHVIVGEVILPPGMRLSGALLHDLESLLIAHCQPFGNTVNTRSRGYSRPGMRVRCMGAWPHDVSEFRD